MNTVFPYMKYIDGYVQDRSNHIANVLELLKSCTNSKTT